MHDESRKTRVCPKGVSVYTIAGLPGVYRAVHWNDREKYETVQIWNQKYRRFHELENAVLKSLKHTDGRWKVCDRCGEPCPFVLALTDGVLCESCIDARIVGAEE